MVRTRFSKVLALVLVFVMVMSSGTSVLAYTVISNVLTATVTVTANPTAAALKAVNDLNITQVESDTGYKMQAALENTALGLNLTEYYNLTAGGRRQAVADYVSFTKFAKGNFTTVAQVQAALNIGVTIEMNKMNFVQLLNNGTTRTLEQIVIAMKADNSNLLTGFTTADIDSFFDIYGGAAAIENQNAVFNSYLILDAAGRSEVETMFKANAYNGSFVTTFGYLKAAIESIPTGPAITLEWLSGGTKDGYNLAIGNVTVGDIKEISFEATANQAVDNVGYLVHSSNYVTIDGITALEHYIDSTLLAAKDSFEQIDLNVKFEVADSYTLTVEAIEQEDTTPAAITNTSMTVENSNNKPRITLGFTLSEGIDLNQNKLGNIIITYGTMNGENFVTALRTDGTPVVKTKLWDGYLSSLDPETKYCGGPFNVAGCINEVPGGKQLLTVVDPNFPNMDYADDAQWMNAMLGGNAAVKIMLIDNEGNISETVIEAN